MPVWDRSLVVFLRLIFSPTLASQPQVPLKYSVAHKKQNKSTRPTFLCRLMPLFRSYREMLPLVIDLTAESDEEPPPAPVPAPTPTPTPRLSPNCVGKIGLELGSE
jgi:hypothetical protein